jgi:uncharacterized protein (DUF697 family)
LVHRYLPVTILGGYDGRKTLEVPKMSEEQQADKVIGSHVVWALGGDLIPVPLFDIAAVTAIQMDMLKQLADVYEVEFTASTGKSFVSALTGSTFARIGASLIKAVPGIGTVIGGISMSAMSGASTYAVGQVAKSIFGSQGGIINIDMQWAKDAYSEALERGKEFASRVEKDSSKDVYESLDKLGKLREQGVITDEEFEAQKSKLLERV